MDQQIPQVRPIPTNHPRTQYNSDNRKQGTETFDYQDNGMEDFSSFGHDSASFYSVIMDSAVRPVMYPVPTNQIWYLHKKPDTVPQR